MAERMLRVLGPTVVEADGERRPVRGLAGQVACILASRFPQSVPSDVIAEALWPNRPPKESRAGLRVALHRLRQLLGDTDAVVNENDGYRLALTPDEIDQLRFEAGAESSSATQLSAVLDLWSGHAYEPFDDDELLRSSSTRLTALRLDVEERYVDALLAEANLDQAAMRASILVDEEPYRERRWELLMMALYRAGRQREALDVASRARMRLREDLGIEPGPALVGLEADILVQAEYLDARSGESISSDAIAGVGLGDLVQGLRELRTEVPRTAGTFVGRTAELEQIEELLGAQRCLTIVGPPGAGKTRLAARVCADRVDRRVVWLDLVGVSIDAVVSQLAGALGLAPGGDTAREVAAELSHEPTVLVLDNAEHLVDAVGEVVGALLEVCASLAVLITSRHRLGRSFETPIDLGPLDLSSATELLAQRAFGGLAVGDARRDELVEAVEYLGRLPLHLELLAPLLRERSVADALARVTVAPAGGANGDRHATLASAIDWSMRTLSPPAVQLHSMLGTFSGWFEAEDVIGVTGWSSDAVADALAELVRHSLVTAELDGRVPTYRQLVGVREHARAQLSTAGRLEMADAVHSEHFRKLTIELGEALEGPDEENAVHRLERTLPQIDLARKRLHDAGDIRGVADISLGVAGSLLLRLDHRRYAWMDHVAGLPEVEDFENATELLSWAALIAWSSGDGDATRSLLRRIERLAGTDEFLPVSYFLAHTNALAYDGSLEERTQSFANLWMASEQRGTTRDRATVASMMTLGYAQLGELDAAAATARRAMRLARDVGNPSSIAWAEFAIGWSQILQNPTAATRSFLSAVRIARTVRTRWLEGLSIAAIATAALRDERYRDVCRLLPEVLRHLGHNRAFPQMARSAREGVIALDAIGRSKCAARLLAHVALVDPVHPMFDDDQVRFDEIAQRLFSDGAVDVVEASSVDPARSWVEMAAILEAAVSAD